MNNFIVVSSDCHAGPHISGYRDYLDPQYREAFDMAMPIEVDLLEKASSSFLIKEINDEWRKGIEEGLKGAWIYENRIQELDRDGVVVEVIFPDGVTEMNTPPFGSGLGLPTTSQVIPDLQWAGAQAHNRWLAEFCSRDKIRHIGLAIIPLVWDIDKAIVEARWAAENGLRGVYIPLMTRGHRSYHHKCYYPFWEACQDLGLIVHFHSGGAPMDDFFGDNWPAETDDGYVSPMGCFVSEVQFWTWRPITTMIWGGVFEQFPKLKAIVTEGGTNWMLPPWLKLLDHNYHDVMFSSKLGDFRSHLSMPPSEYFKRNVGIGASCISRLDAEARHEIGVKQLMWGNDYPHPEGTWPNTHEQLLNAFKGLPEDDIALILGENAIEFYGIDREAAKAIAERIGPKRSDFL